ncbi:MAG: hypothetical protein Q9181_005022 [Wetmoreana brouardii]
MNLLPPPTSSFHQSGSGLAIVSPPSQNNAGKQKAGSTSSLSSIHSDFFEDFSEGKVTRPEPKPTSRDISREFYTDQFGLEQPAPPSLLYGGRNVDRYTGRRTYDKRALEMLPFHHDPITRIGKECLSTSAFQMYSYIQAEIRDLVNDSIRTCTDHGSSIRHLQDVESFVRETEALTAYDPSPRPRTLENRMEELLKVYGYNKTNSPTREATGKGKQTIH